MGTIISVAIMVVGVIGMIICSKKQKTNPAMQPVSILLFLIVAGAAAYFCVQQMGCNSSASVMESELAFLASRGHAAGVHLQKVAAKIAGAECGGDVCGKRGGCQSTGHRVCSGCIGICD